MQDLSNLEMVIIRPTMHLIEENLKEYEIDLTFKPLLAGTTSVMNAFTFYDSTSPYNVMYGRQHDCLSDLELPDFSEKEVNTQYRQRRIRQTSIKTITQTTVVVKD